MNIGIVGYGKMGQAIERLAIQRGHQVTAIVASDEDWKQKETALSNTSIVFEFTEPEAAYGNLDRLMDMGKSVVCGTTGWLDKQPYIIDKCMKNKAAFLYASNFSIGVNLLFELNKQLAKWTAHIPDFEVSLQETHHIHKKDAPSGTAMTLLEGILRNNNNFLGWSDDPADFDKDGAIAVKSNRKGDIFGIHQVQYRSANDLISIRHEALSRDGFATGALIAAEWLVGRQGIYSMQDVMRLV